jgi:hypothetical protein
MTGGDTYSLSSTSFCLLSLSFADSYPFLAVVHPVDAIALFVAAVLLLALLSLLSPPNNLRNRIPHLHSLV